MHARRSRGKEGKHQPRPIVGAAWCRCDQWDRLREVSEDWAELEETWEEWSQAAEEALQRARAMGLDIRKVDVDVEELMRWCQAERRPINSESRSAFAAVKLQEGGAA
jgi:hypothetical protein